MKLNTILNSRLISHNTTVNNLGTLRNAHVSMRSTYVSFPSFHRTRVFAALRQLRNSEGLETETISKLVETMEQDASIC